MIGSWRGVVGFCKHIHILTLQGILEDKLAERDA